METLNNAEKEAKLKMAITLGYIIASQDVDGLIRYELTRLGASQWVKETGYVF